MAFEAGGQRSDPITKAEAEFLVRGIINKQDKALVALVLDTGIKSFEISQIKRKDINYIIGTISLIDYERRITRRIYVSSNVLDLLRDFEIHHLQEVLFPFTVSGLDNKVQIYTSKILGKERTWRALRRTYVVLSATSQRDIRTTANNSDEPVDRIFALYDKKTFDMVKDVSSKPLLSLKS